MGQVMQHIADEAKPEEKCEDRVEVEIADQVCPDGWIGRRASRLLRVACGCARNGVHGLPGVRHMRAAVPIRQRVMRHTAGVTNTVPRRASMPGMAEVPQVE